MDATATPHDPLAPQSPEEWHLPLNYGEWHLMVTNEGVFRVKPTTTILRESVRLYPGRLHAWHFFNPDGSLRPEYAGAPVFEGLDQRT